MKWILAIMVLGITGCPTTGSLSGAAYPLDTCIVTDNKLGSMGPPITNTYRGQDVKFCCKPCIKKFYQNPDKYMDKLK